MSTANPALVVVKRTRAILLTHGWCQGKEQRDAQPMDAALAMAGKELHETGSWGGLTLAFHALTAACGENIQDWNEAKERTKADVVALLDQVIEDLS